MTAAASGPLRVALTSLGCKVNYAEMAELAGTLAAAGCDVVPDSEPADVRVLNSCTVTLQADATTRQRLARLRRQDPGAHLILTGCSVDANADIYLAPQRGQDTARSARGIDAVFSNLEKHAIAEHVLTLAPHGKPPGRRPPLRSRAFIKVQDGCNHRCTYCIVWRARGASRSVAPGAVRERCAAAIAAGHRELVLCGVDLGSYGRELGTSLEALLAQLLADVGTAARIRLSSINANDVRPGLIELNAHPRLCAHWHMPLQSGSDRVLRDMHRGYRRAQYLRVVDALRGHRPETTFTTDVMVGFPGETEEDHEQTLDLVQAVGFLSCHVFRWSARPGTPATALDGRVDDATARRRSAAVRHAAQLTGRAAMQAAVGRVHEVVWDSVAEGTAHGLTSGYHEILTTAGPGISPTQLSTVRATALDGNTLRGTVVAS